MGYCEVGPIEIGMVNEIFSWKRLVTEEKISDGKVHDFLDIFKIKQTDSEFEPTFSII